MEQNEFLSGWRHLRDGCMRTGARQERRRNTSAMSGVCGMGRRTPSAPGVCSHVARAPADALQGRHGKLNAGGGKQLPALRRALLAPPFS